MSIEGLKGLETVLGTSSLEMAATLTTSGLDYLELAVERVYLHRDVEDTSICLVVAGNLGGQPPVIRAASQLNGLVIGR